MCDSRRAYTSDVMNPTTAITAATRTAVANPIAWATSVAAPAVPAVAAELESKPINSDGPNDAAIMFHVLSNAVP